MLSHKQANGLIALVAVHVTLISDRKLEFALWKDEVHDLLEVDDAFLCQVIGNEREAASPLQDN